MKRRRFIQTATSAVLAAGALKAWQQYQQGRSPDILAYLDRQITPAAAAQASAEKVSQNDGNYGKLGEGDIFWSVMWPYMYTVGRAEGTVGNSLGLDPYRIIYTYDTFESFDDHPRRAHPILDEYSRPTGKSSDAAGWPQFISTTWDETVAANPFWTTAPLSSS